MAASDHDQFLPAGHLPPVEEKDGPSFPAGRQASSLPVRGRKLRVAGCDGAGGVRVPIYLFYFQGLTTQEIARALSIRPGAVRMRLSRGRERLRQTLKGDYFDE